jgi:hypothetical protein
MKIKALMQHLVIILFPVILNECKFQDNGFLLSSVAFHCFSNRFLFIIFANVVCAYSAPVFFSLYLFSPLLCAVLRQQPLTSMRINGYPIDVHNQIQAAHYTGKP